ncbi:membrane protein [Streptomyces capparidis]
MNSAPHLQSEDRQDFERVLDEALHDEEKRHVGLGAPARLNSEQLRTLALEAVAAINACAAAEYARYLDVREEVRRSGSGERAVADGTTGTDDGGGAGMLAVVTVLTPILAGLSAVVLLCVGYLMKLEDPDPDAAGSLVFAGWLFAGIAVAGLVTGMIAVVLTALRNTAADAEALRVAASPEVAAARDAWRDALRERGVRPFLERALSAAEPADRTPPVPSGNAGPARRTSPLGYSRPGFSSPNPDDPAEPRHGPEFSSPRYTSPEFSSPDFDTGFGRPDTDRA